MDPLNPEFWRIIFPADGRDHLTRFVPDAFHVGMMSLFAGFGTLAIGRRQRQCRTLWQKRSTKFTLILVRKRTSEMLMWAIG